jgi:phenylpropionate dioxygenase-like ring-hydroxylating dioxygenase large terminal subunit
MLPQAQNELLTRTGPDTPLGQLYRRYWVPALLTEEIATPDSPPVRVKLLGEELVAFRDSNGRIGLLEEHCPHRGTSLFFARNEECGLTCVYHGWKLDVEGNVVDTPAEPPGSDFKKKIHHRAYPTKEAAGVVFAYLGPKEKMPLFPNYAWIKAAPDRTYVTKCLQECNYLQGLEGECDSSHLSFLHRDFGATGRRALFAQDVAPAYEVEETDFGVRMVAIRNAGAGQQYVRISSFVMPMTCCISARAEGFEIHIYVPADDAHSWRYDLGLKRTGPVTEEDLHRRKQIGPDYCRIRNLQSDYLQDRRAQKSQSYTGIEDFLNHDSCASETMGAIYDRTKEHLGVSDVAVIAVRKFLLNAVNSFQRGGEPPHLVKDPEKNSFPHIASVAEIIPSDIPWRQRFAHLTQPTDGNQ